MTVLPCDHRAIPSPKSFTAAHPRKRIRRRLALTAAATAGLAASSAWAAPGVPIRGNPPVAATLGTALTVPPNFVYDPATGDLSFSWNNASILSGTNYISALNVLSTSGLLLFNNASTNITSLQYNIHNGTQLAAALLTAPGFAKGFDLGPILPPNLSAGALAVDLSLGYTTSDPPDYTALGRSHFAANLLYPGVASFPIDVYTGPSGNWSSAQGWSLGRAPQTGEAALLSPTASATLVSFDAPASGIVLSKLTLNATGTASITLSQNQGALSVNGDEIIGDNGNGAVSLSGGAHTVAGNLLIANSVNGNGAYTLSAGSLKVVNAEVIGRAGSGAISQFGGTHTIAGSLTLGSGTGATGTYSLNAGTLIVTAAEVIGLAGNGVFNQTGGVHQAGPINLSPASGATATLNIGGGTATAASLTMRPSGQSTLNLFGGTLIVNGFESIGSPLGKPVNAVINQSGGSHITSQDLALGQGAIYNLSGGSLSTGTGLQIGTGSTFNFSGGSVKVTGGDELNITGRLNLTGDGTRIIPGHVHNISGTVTATKTIVQFTGEFQNGGTYVSQQADTYFNNLVLGAYSSAKPLITAGVGDRFFITGNFTAAEGSPTTFDVAGAEFHFSGGGIHQYKTSGVFNTVPIPSVVVDPGNTLNLAGGTAAAIINLGNVTATPVSSTYAFPNTSVSSLIGNGNLTVGGGTTSISATLIVGTLDQSAAVINNFARLNLGQGTQVTTSTLSSLTIKSGGKLDVNRSALVLNYGTNNTPLPQVRSWLATGHGSNGLWNGTGITSTFAATNQPKFGIGYTEGADRFIPGLTPGQLLMRPTLYGDVNFSGKTDQADINQITARGHLNDGTGNHAWIDGDMNYDGFVNTADIRIIALSGNYSGTFQPASASSSATASAAPAFRYDPATGDVTLDSNRTPNIADLHLFSAGHLFLPDHSTFSGFATLTPGELENVLLGSSFADGYDLGNILPAGLSTASVQADVTALYGITGSGVEQPAALTPEPASLMAIGTAGVLLLGRRRQKRQR
jgi:hypothetical protein